MFDEDFSKISEIWENNDSTTKFKMGQVVRNKRNNVLYAIKGVNIQDESSVEYALSGYPYLVWEHELEEV